MLEVAVRFEKAFSRFDMLDPGFSIELESDLDDEVGVHGKVDWMNARRMISFLKIFNEITCKIFGSLYVTSNVFLHEIYKIYHLLKAWIGGRDVGLSNMAGNVKRKLDKY